MELFDYLELAYNKSSYKNEGITLEEFIRMWLYENDICNGNYFTEIRDGKLYGYHTRTCEIDMKNRSIKLLINKRKE